MAPAGKERLIHTTHQFDKFSDKFSTAQGMLDSRAATPSWGSSTQLPGYGQIAQNKNPECLLDVSNLVGGVVDLVATTMEAPMVCFKQPRDCSTSTGWKNLHQASVVWKLTGIGATTVASTALLKHLCINDNTDDIAGATEFGIAPWVYLLLKVASSTGDILEVRDFGNDWISDNFSTSTSEHP